MTINTTQHESRATARASSIMPHARVRALSFTAACTLMIALPAAKLAAQAGSAATNAGTVASSAEARSLDSIASAVMRAHRVPGVSVAVVRGTDTLLLKGYGVADVEHNVPVTPETVFRIGSLTKQVTAAAVMKLVEDGKLRLEGTIGEYLPGYSGPGARVTIHQLLNHTSGIPSYTSLGDAFWGKSRLDLTHEQMLAIFARDSLRFEPGSRHEYNNSGYYILGMIIEKVTGKSYEDHVRSSIAMPHGLRTLQMCDQARIIPHRAQGYEVDGAAIRNASPVSMSGPFAAGALCSTARDLVKWNEALVSGDVVAAISYATMTTPTKMSDGSVHPYGYGLVAAPMREHRMISHSGGINGFTSYLIYLPAQDITIVALGNTASDAPGTIAMSMARRLLGVPEPPPAPPARDEPLSVAEQAKYHGTYDLAPAVPLKIRVFSEDGRLYAQATGQGGFLLRYQGDNVFLGPDATGIRIVFTVVNDKATQMVLHQAGRGISGVRVADQ